MFQWLTAAALAARRIDPADLAQIKVTREPAEVVEIVGAARERQELRRS